jgi:thymidylate synthase
VNFHTHQLSWTYPSLLKKVVQEGEEVDTRIGLTREAVNLNLEIMQPQHCIVGRDGFSKEFMELEIAMLLAGTYVEDLVRDTVPRAADLIAQSTAYGPRIFAQLELCENELTDDPGTRRAVVYVGREYDLASVRHATDVVKGEMPCTMNWQFLLRNGRLDMIVNMRSWDLVWGLAYDVPCFVAAQMALCRALGCHLGKYYHNAGSAHVYERHWGVRTWPNAHRGELVVNRLGSSIVETRSLNARHIEAKRKALA